MRPLLIALVATAAAMAAPAPAKAQGQVTVYCSILEELCRDGAAMFERNTGTKVSMVRKSTGETYAQLKAEAANPRGDVWWGGPGESHLQAAEEGLLEEYRSPALANLRDWAVRHAERSKYRTSGIYLGALGIGVNTAELAKRGIPEPKCWVDLLDPKLKGEVQMADPNSSGTAYTMLATIVQVFGEDKGFDYLKGLHRNINQYTKSGIAPVNALSLGETAVSISFMHDIVTQKLKGAPVKVVAPCEGTGYETGSTSVIKGAKNLENGKLFADFTQSKEAQELFFKMKAYAVPSNKALDLPAEALDISTIKLIDYDTGKYGAAEVRTRLLKKWDADVKSLPR